MGVDLSVYGNHNILFDYNSLIDTAEEIKTRLKKITFINDDFLFHACLFRKYGNNYSEKEISKMKRRLNWHYKKKSLDEIHKKEDLIDFYGYYGLEISINQYYILMWDPWIRYNDWFEDYNKENFKKDPYINEWRKYFKQIIDIFKGDRLIYYPDCGFFSKKANTDPDQPFANFEKNVLIETDNSTDLIDKLDDIDWEKNYNYENWLPKK